MENIVEYGRLYISMYLPHDIIPENINDLNFDEFFKLYAMAEIARDLRIQDIEIGTNKGYVESFSDD